MLDENRSVMTGCPHCLHVLKNEYRSFGGRYEVQHHSQVIKRLIGDGSNRTHSVAVAEVHRLGKRRSLEWICERFQIRGGDG